MRKLAIALVLICGGSQHSRAADIIWVHEMRGGGDGENNPDVGEGSLTWENDQWRDLIESQGHNIIKHAPYNDLEAVSIADYDNAIEELEAADLVIFSRDSNSGNYADPIENETWTSAFSTPMLIMTPYVLRGSRWGMVPATGIVDATNPMLVEEPQHPIFDGIELTDGTVEFWSQLGENDNIDLVDTTDFGFGQVLATDVETESPWIVYWDGESNDGDFYDGSVAFAGGPRLFLSAGSDDDPNTWGEKNITAAGDQIVLNAISFLTGDPGNPPIVAPNDCDFDGSVGVSDLSCIIASGGADGLASLLQETGLIAGDLDGNGEVAFADFLTLSSNFGKTDVSYPEGDIDGNGEVAFGDFLTLSANFGTTSSAVVALPEPQAESVIPCVLVALFLRRKR